MNKEIDTIIKNSEFFWLKNNTPYFTANNKIEDYETPSPISVLHIEAPDVDIIELRNAWGWNTQRVFIGGIEILINFRRNTNKRRVNVFILDYQVHEETITLHQ